MESIAARRRARRALGALALAATAAVAVGAAAHADPVDLVVVDRDAGQGLQVWRQAGSAFVAGRPGARYSLRLTNNTSKRELVVLSVDGVNVMTGETAAYNQKGYILRPYESYVVSGWRKSDSTVAAFNFTTLSSSYAALTGRPGNVGVIGMAVFDERIAAPFTPSAYLGSRDFNIPTGDAATALAAWSAASGVKLDAPASLLNGVRTAGIFGRMDPRAALNNMIAGTKLQIIVDDGSQISLGSAVGDTVSSVNVNAIGTNIPGVKAVGAPVQRVSREDLMKSGATDIRSALQTLPVIQTAGGVGDAAGITGIVRGPDQSGQSFGENADVQTADIGGQGSRATLTLLDGQRLAESGLNTGLTGISQVPRPAPAVSPALGTGHGALETSVITILPFERATPYPQFTAQIQYDSYDNLVARGVIPPPRPPVRQPQAFPGAGYVPDPPRR